MTEATDDEKSYYEVLGVEKDFTATELKTAYRRRARNGPYRHGDHGGNNANFTLLVKAYETLSDPVMRAAYDMKGKPTIARPQKSPSFNFGTHRCRKPVQLAQAMGENWGLACSIIASSEFSNLEKWLRKFRIGSDLEVALDACRNQAHAPDRLVALLIATMAPDIEPKFQGASAGRASLARIAKVVSRASTPERHLVDSLWVSGALIAYRGVVSCEDYARLDELWHRNVSTLLDWSLTLPQLLKAVDAAEESVMRAAILHQILRSSHTDSRGLAVAEEDLAAAMKCTWFAGFHRNRSVPASDYLRPAYIWATSALIPAARQEVETAERLRKLRLEREIREQLTRRQETIVTELRRAREREEQAKKQAERDKREAERERDRARERERQERKRAARAEHEAAHAEKERRRAAHAERERQRVAEQDERERRYAAERRARLQEQAATGILKDPDGPVNRYRVALEVERAVAGTPLGATLHFTEPLAPVPLAGTPLDQVVALAALLPVAARRLEVIAERSASLAQGWRTAADRQVSALKTPAPPVPRPQPPLSPAIDRSARSFRRRSAAALLAVLGLPLVWIYGVNAYSGGTDVLGDGLLALAGIAALVAGGIAVWQWLVSARGGFESLRRDAAARTRYEDARRAYDRKLEERVYLVRQRDEAERERAAALARAKEHSQCEHQRADAVDALARRSRIGAADLLEPAMVSRLSEVVKQARSNPAP